MNKTVEAIEATLVNDYGPAYLAAFAAQAGDGTYGVPTFKSDVGAELPELFYEFYEWALASGSSSDEIANIPLVSEGPYVISDLRSIKGLTKDWNGIKSEQPGREWLDGFVALQEWDGAYNLVVDTKGAVGKARTRFSTTTSRAAAGTGSVTQAMRGTWRRSWGC